MEKIKNNTQEVSSEGEKSLEARRAELLEQLYEIDRAKEPLMKELFEISDKLKKSGK